MRKLFNFLTLALMLFTAMGAYAIPARRVVSQYTQPDGSTISLRLVGDEFSHYYLTDDDQMVIAGNDGYYFATLNAQGLAVASDVLATAPAKRTAEARRLLASVKKEDLVKGMAKVRTRNVAARPNNSMKAPAKAAASNWPSGIGLFPNNTYPTTGSPDAVIILVQFPDQKFTLPDPKAYFTGFASKEGFSESGLVGGTNPDYNAHGSALDYFKASSNGQFTPNFHVLGPVTLPNNMAYYGGNDVYGDDKNPHLMVLHAVQALDATTDFSIFDTDNDGYIDNVYVIYSGQGEANGGSADTVWPHSWSVYSGTRQYYRFDGKILDSYACSAEVFAKSGSLTLADGIGTFCHEFSHVMGLPDLYQTEYNSSTEMLTPSDYSLMDYGSYLNNSRTPPTYSIFERNAMGWAEIEVLEEGVGKNGVLEHMLKSNKGYAIRANGDNEFFLLENRQLSDWDAYIPYHGMLVWHINYDATIWKNNAPNNSAKQCVDIVEAGGTANNSSTATLKQYPFPGTKNVTSFTSSTTPALKSWANTPINVPLTNIKENADGTITFDICGGESKLDVPVCNFTESTVVSAEPITITLTKPASAPASSVINYIYMDNDATEMLEGPYTGPVTISKSGEFEYWLEDGQETSQVTNLKIYIGERPDLEYTIVYTDSTNDSGTVITSATYPNLVEEGSEIATCGSASNVYPGKTGLKFSSTKNSGSLTLKLSADYQLPYSKVIVKAVKFSNDVASLKVGSGAAQNMTGELEDYTFELDGSDLKSITISATKRLYVKSITFVLASGGEDPDPVVETVATPTFSVEAGEVEQGTVVELACETEGAAIHFTVDGTEPTAESDLYTDPIVIEEDMTIKAIAVKDGWNDSEVATAAYTVKPEQGGDDPIEGDAYTVTFDFNSDNGYGMTLLSGNTQEYNDEEHKCVEGPITLTLHGKTRWWDAGAKGKHLRLYKDAYITVSCPQPHDLRSVHLTVGNENHWDNTSHVSKVASVDFTTTHTSGNTVLNKVEVNYITTTSIVDVDAEANEAVYYNLQGIRVENPAHGVFIRVQGNKATKVVK